MTDVWALGVTAFELIAGRRPFEQSEGAPSVREQVLDLGAPSPPLQSGNALYDAIVAACLRKRPAERPSASDVLSRIEACLAGSDPELGDEPPFRGLEPFEERHAAYFRGRDAEVDALLERARSQPVIVVVGPSGAGKSSIVAAGFVPRMRDREGGLRLLTVRPGDAPFLNLARRLVTEGVDDAPEALAARLEEAPGALSRELVDLARQDGRRVLLFVDQLEELYVQVSDVALRQRYAGAIAVAADDAEDPVRVLCTLRDDYLGAAAESLEMRRVLERPFVLRAPAREALREAILSPLRRAGGEFDDETLVDEMLDEVGGDPSCLPLLQFTCRALWDGRDVTRNLLRRDRYRDIKGVAGSLATHAEQVVVGLGPEDLRRVRSVFEHLVTRERTCRRIGRAALLEASKCGERALERLLRARLVVASAADEAEDPVLGLVHESLVLHWARLSSWLEESREARALREDLDDAVRHWHQTGDISIPQSRDLRRRADQLASDLTPGHRDYLRTAGRRETHRRALAVTVAVALVAITLGALEAARRFAEDAREAEAARGRVERSLAEADIGHFVLELSAYDWDPDRRVARFLPAGHARLEWGLHRLEAGAPGERADVEQDRRPGPTPGSWIVEARSGAAVLRVDRGPCPPSMIAIAQLPGYSKRREDEARRVRVQVPTCAASAAGMLPVPAGPYSEREVVGGAARLVDVPGFAIDRTEVSNAAYDLYAKMADFTGDPPPDYPTPTKGLEQAGDADRPVTAVNQTSAAAYCRYMGKRLPTAREWRKAARGGATLADGRANEWPIRDVPWAPREAPLPLNLAGVHDGHLASAPVGSYPDGASPYGVLDLAGNVYEWTASADRSSPKLAIILGGGWESSLERGEHLIDYENLRFPRFFALDIGFRCVSDMP